jgi:DNA-binding transcriptional MerR regulator
MGTQPAGDDRAKGQGNRETWRDWQAEGAPEPHLFTRKEVLATVERWGVTPRVDEETLRFWERQGLLPRPTRQYHAGAVRTRYPWWVADLIAQIRRYQDAGQKLAHLGERLRAEARRLSRGPGRLFVPPSPEELDRSPTLRTLLTLHEVDTSPRVPGLPPFIAGVSVPPRTARALADALALLAAHHRPFGFAAVHAEVRLVDAHGQALELTVPLQPEGTRDPQAQADDRGDQL